MATTLERHFDAEFKCEEVSILLDSHMVVFGDRYKREKGDYAHVLWNVHPDKSVDYYVHQLAQFYEKLKSGGFPRTFEKPIGLKMQAASFRAINLSEKDITAVSFSTAMEKRLPEFNIIHVLTPYADFGMESDFTRQQKNWTPAHGRLAVRSHLDISRPLYDLIAATCMYDIRKSSIENLLRVIFTFENSPCLIQYESVK